jgi:hypothetical protein
LPNTKVEKRPLGAFANTPSVSTNSPNLEGNKPTSSDKPTGNETPLPPELQDDLLAVETTEDTVPSSKASEPKKDAPKAGATSTDSPQPIQTQPVSIVQQYKERIEKAEEPIASIFDSQNSGKAIGSKKKKSGWTTVMWIVLLIVFGAGAGAAVYFYVLPLI